VMKAASMTHCLENCAACERVCTETLAAVLSRSDVRADARLIRLLMDCADICGTSARFLMRQSERHPSTCRACADVCADCAAACEAVAGDDDLSRCAQACRRCAATCEEMAGATHAAHA
jgi:hypothetical protein